jgi:hypothetical protein
MRAIGDRRVPRCLRDRRRRLGQPIGDRDPLLRCVMADMHIVDTP